MAIYSLPGEVLERIIKEAVGIGEKKKAIELGNEPKFLSQNKAYKIYGESNVDTWIRKGIVKKYKDSCKPNSRVRISCLELETAAYQCNVTSKLSPLGNAEMVEIICSK